MKLIIATIIATGLMNTVQAQLASEKPVTSFYSKTTIEKLKARNDDHRPAAPTARQVFPSQKASHQASVPARIRKQKATRRKN
jgi:hypothetical protein